MVKIRLRRMGAKKAPYYRVVVADSRYPRDGRFIEEIGTYNPCVNPAEIKIDADRLAADEEAALGMKNDGLVHRAQKLRRGALPSSACFSMERISAW